MDSKKSSFLKEFFKSKREVGALSPSSKFLGKKMCSKIDFDKANLIVELGPGNGVFTKEILKRMKPNAKLISIEINEYFCQKIKSSIQDNRLVLINGTAEKIQDYITEQGYEKADYIISSLPLTVIPKELKEKILNASLSALDSEGSFVQFQYSLNALKLLKNNFDDVKLSFAPLNIPPAFVYDCKNVETDS